MSVRPVKNEPSSSSHADRKSKQRSITAEESEFFRSLLGGMQNSTMLNNIAAQNGMNTLGVQASASTNNDLLSTINENMIRSPSTLNTSSDATLNAQQQANLDPQMLSLRVSTGPLAGMLLQAGWQGNKLNLTFSCPKEFDTERLQGQIEKIETALAAGLGCGVMVKVDQDDQGEKHGE